MNDKKSYYSRRKLLKSIAAGSGAMVAGKALPEAWTKPVVESVMLPAHATTTKNINTQCEEESHVRVFDDSNVADDVFDVFIDGAFVFRTPIGGGKDDTSCAGDLSPGDHTLRIEFILDDDAGCSEVDENASGTYGIILANGTTFVSGPEIVSDNTASGDLFPCGAFHDYVIKVV